MINTMRTDLLVGTTNGLWVVPRSDEIVAPQRGRRLLDGLWISSISRMLTKTHQFLITTRTGRVGILQDSRFSEVGELPERLWFATEIVDGGILAGTTPPRLYIARTPTHPWQVVAGFDELATSLSWKSHSGREAHLNTFCSDPQLPSRMFLAVEVGGVVRSDDSGHSWHDVTFNLDPDVHKIVISDLQGRTIYAATGSGVGALREGATHWSLLGPPGLPYSQGLVHHPKRCRLYVSCSRTPFGRRTTGEFVGTSQENEFAICFTDDDGLTWSRLGADIPQFSGILSKALVLQAEPPYALYAGALDGRVFCFEESGNWELVAEGLGQIECLELGSME